MLQIAFQALEYTKTANEALLLRSDLIISILQEPRAGNATISSFESRDPWAEEKIQTLFYDTICYLFIRPGMMIFQVV